MRTRVLARDNEVLRFREEEFGCVITDGARIGEGNDVAYMVMLALSEGHDLDELYDLMAETFGINRETAERDVNDFIATMHSYNWLKWVEVSQ